MGIIVGGIISHRDKQPYIQIDIDGRLAQLSMAQARKVAADIVQQCARTEADAMIYRFFDKQDYPKGAADALMMEFRNFREALDTEIVEGQNFDPDSSPGRGGTY